jgi:Nif-specific regulatory protein
VEGYLVFLNGMCKGKCVPLQPEKTMLGRHASNDVVLPDEYCSRKHAEIVVEAGRFVIRNLSEINYTYVNERRVDALVLRHGFEIRMGTQCLLFQEGKANGARPSFPRGLPGAKGAVPTMPAPADDATEFEADELALLYHFVTGVGKINDVRYLLQQALEMVRMHTRAALVGFLSLNDRGTLLRRLVLPEAAEIDVRETRRLIERVEKKDQPVWLNDPRRGDSRERLGSYDDAIAVPIPTSDGQLGTLHVYGRKGHFNERQYRFCVVVAGHLADRMQVLRKLRRLEVEASLGRDPAEKPEEWIGSSPAMQQLKQTVHQVRDAIGDRPRVILIRGETGSGKELVARALQRPDGPFVVQNCAALPRELAESLLFGHEKGAFTGATERREGCFVRAHEGTLFLDEVGRLPLESQAKLLRALENFTVTPVGGEDIDVNVRCILATNLSLEKAVEKGEFLPDLFYRIRTIPIPVPPLRDHLEDIPELVQYFLGRLVDLTQRPIVITAAALDRLQRHSWPGNVRELRNVLEGAVVMLEGNTIDADDLKLAADVSPGYPATLRRDDWQKWCFEKARDLAGGKASVMAELMGVQRGTVYAIAKRNGWKLHD